MKTFLCSIFVLSNSRRLAGLFTYLIVPVSSQLAIYLRATRDIAGLYIEHLPRQETASDVNAALP
jgi:hypothetical protein